MIIKTELPDRINVMRVISYDTAEIRKSIAELNDVPVEEVTDKEILDLIQDWITEDFQSQLGKELWLDEHGNEVEA